MPSKRLLNHCGLCACSCSQNIEHVEEDVVRSMLYAKLSSLVADLHAVHRHLQMPVISKRELLYVRRYVFGF